MLSNVKYYTTALALKAFSVNNTTRELYRNLGNLKNRIKGINQPISTKYFFRTEKFLNYCGAIMSFDQD